MKLSSNMRYIFTV